MPDYSCDRCHNKPAEKELELPPYWSNIQPLLESKYEQVRPTAHVCPTCYYEVFHGFLKMVGAVRVAE